MSLKKKQLESQGEGLNYNFIHGQVEDDTHDARISVIIDAGTQEAAEAVYGTKMDVTNVSYFLTEEEAFDYGDRAEKIVGGYIYGEEGWDEQPEEVEATKEIIEEYKVDAEVGQTLYQVNFKIVQPKPREEVIYAVDLVDTYVNYKEDGTKGDALQYRVWLNQRDFMTKELKGFSTNFAPPKGKNNKGWTFSPLSMHSKLAEATGELDIINPQSADHGDLSLLLDKPIGIPTTQKHSESNGKEYINLKIGAPVRLSKKLLNLGITELDCTPEAIDFETATVEQFENAKPNKLVIAKIKKSIDYEGSQMQKALEEWEASKGSSNKTEVADEDKQETSKEEVPKKSVEKAKAKTKAPVDDEEVDADDVFGLDD